jgi:hypothetical protein
VRYCTTCGRPVAEDKRFCTACGRPLAGPGPAVPAAADVTLPAKDATLPANPGGHSGAKSIPSYGTAGPGMPPPGRPARGTAAHRRSSWIAAIAASVIMILAGASAGIWLATRYSPATGSGLQSDTAAAGSSPGSAAAQGQSPAVPASPTASSVVAGAPPTPSPAVADNTVTVSAAAAADAREPAVAAFLQQYFTAINSHDYQQYRSLLGPQAQAALTRAEFNRGFRSTVDSDEILRVISTDAAGDTVTGVTFISHQDPADSVNGQQACTHWRISLFLQPAGVGYVIGQAPPSYHASYSPCP